MTTVQSRLLAALATTAGLLLPLLGRMRTELLREGQFPTPTATAMYGVYAVQAATVLAAARRRPFPMPRSVLLAPLGAAVGGAGTVLMVSGMRRFASPAQLTGTTAGDLLTGGVYRWSRNPQYIGLVTALLGLGLARRSGGVLLVAAGTAGVYAWWVRVEETALSATFGDVYVVYRRRTAHWFGPPRQG